MFDCKNLEICKHYFIKNPSYFMKNQPRRIKDRSKMQKSCKNKSPEILRWIKKINQTMVLSFQ